MTIDPAIENALPVLREMGNDVFDQERTIVVLNQKFHMTAARLIRAMSKDEYDNFLMNNVM